MLRGREFYKLSGSGNDFVFIDARAESLAELMAPGAVAALCERRTGVGADGIVLLERSATADLRIRYLNRDGSEAALCGNAALCAARLALELGAAEPGGFALETGTGIVSARAVGGEVEIDLQPPAHLAAAWPAIELEAGERRAGYVVTGVPHLVILCDDVSAVDAAGRGAPLRAHESFPEGANVNWVSRAGERGEWRYRTYERGVEAETLACGTGAVSCALLLATWGLGEPTTRLRTSSGRLQTVRFGDVGGQLRPSLSGEARIVFRGTLGELD